MAKRIPLFMVLALVVLTGVATYFASKQQISAKGTDHHLIFASTGQAYVGTIKSIDDTFITLTNVYSVKNPEAFKKINAGEKPKLILSKFEQEFLGTSGTVYLNKTNVLSYEPLRPDSKIRESIREFETQSPTPLASDNAAPAP